MNLNNYLNIKNNGKTRADNNTLDVEAVVALRYLSNFWKSLDLSLINCEIELVL